MIADKNMRRTSLMIVTAWILSLLISTPMHIDAPGFSNFKNLVTEETFDETDCIPPVDDDSIGFVLYSSTLAFFIPFLILGGLQSVIFYKRKTSQDKRVNEYETSLENPRVEQIQFQCTGKRKGGRLEEAVHCDRRGLPTPAQERLS